MEISDKDSMGTPPPEKDQRGSDDWFNCHGFKRWDKPPGSGRKHTIGTRKLFERELEAWCTDPGRWPSNRNYKAFTEWFRVEVSHMVCDLAPDPIVYN